MGLLHRHDEASCERSKATGCDRFLEVTVLARTGCFRRSDRILRPREFSHVLEHGKRLRSRDFVVAVYRGDRFLRPDRKNGCRLGITVSKRVGNAVIRNRVKRGIREWFRQARKRLPEGAEVVVHEVIRSRVVQGTFAGSVADYHADSVELGKLMSATNVPVIPSSSASTPAPLGHVLSWGPSWPRSSMQRFESCSHRTFMTGSSTMKRRQRLLHATLNGTRLWHGCRTQAVPDRRELVRGVEGSDRGKLTRLAAHG